MSLNNFTKERIEDLLAAWADRDITQSQCMNELLVIINFELEVAYTNGYNTALAQSIDMVRLDLTPDKAKSPAYVPIRKIKTLDSLDMPHPDEQKWDLLRSDETRMIERENNS